MYIKLMRTTVVLLCSVHQGKDDLLVPATIYPTIIQQVSGNQISGSKRTNLFLGIRQTGLRRTNSMNCFYMKPELLP